VCARARACVCVCVCVCAVCGVRCAVCGVQCAVCSVQCAVCGVRCAVCGVSARMNAIFSSQQSHLVCAVDLGKRRVITTAVWMTLHGKLAVRLLDVLCGCRSLNTEHLRGGGEVLNVGWLVCGSGGGGGGGGGGVCVRACVWSSVGSSLRGVAVPSRVQQGCKAGFASCAQRPGDHSAHAHTCWWCEGKCGRSLSLTHTHSPRSGRLAARVLGRGTARAL
jgi:hypothetical protein